MKHFRVKRFLSMALMTSLLLLVACGETAPREVIVEDGWVRLPPPGSGMTAGFGVIRNETGRSVTLDAWSSEEFRDVSLHRTEVVDGVSRMRGVDRVELAPGEALLLEPGGYHLMLMAPTTELTEGQSVHVTASGQGTPQATFELAVVRR